MKSEHERMFIFPGESLEYHVKNEAALRGFFSNVRCDVIIKLRKWRPDFTVLVQRSSCWENMALYSSPHGFELWFCPFV